MEELGEEILTHRLVGIFHLVGLAANILKTRRGAREKSIFAGLTAELVEMKKDKIIDDTREKGKKYIRDKCTYLLFYLLTNKNICV